jgi:hypothetical protein
MPSIKLKSNMKPRVYVETSIPSYLTARRSRDLIATANQELTQEWWETRRDDFYLVISEFVLREASAGDPIAASNRLALIVGIPELNVTDEVGELARMLIEQIPIPKKAQLDAFHIAIAAVHGIDYSRPHPKLDMRNSSRIRILPGRVTGLTCSLLGYDGSICSLGIVPILIMRNSDQELKLSAVVKVLNLLSFVLHKNC